MGAGVGVCVGWVRLCGCMCMCVRVSVRVFVRV